MLVIIFLAIAVITLFIFYRDKTTPFLLATVGQDGNLVYWKDISENEKTELAVAYELVKSSMSETLNLRIAKRSLDQKTQLPGTVYMVSDKDMFYFFIDNYPYKAPGLEVVGSCKLNSIHFNRNTKEFFLTKTQR